MLQIIAFILLILWLKERGSIGGCFMYGFYLLIIFLIVFIIGISL